jgi:hypothetical protein
MFESLVHPQPKYKINITTLEDFAWMANGDDLLGAELEQLYEVFGDPLQA